MKGYLFGLDSQYNMLAKYFDFIYCLLLLIRYTISSINTHSEHQAIGQILFVKTFAGKSLNLFSKMPFNMLILTTTYTVPRLNRCRLANLFFSKILYVCSFVGLKTFWLCSK